MLKLFFNASGRISPDTFIRAFGLLTCVGVIASVLQYLVSPNAQFLHFALIGPYVCVYAKRFHDAGQSGWLLILIWLASSIAQAILSAVLLMSIMPLFLAPEQLDVWNAVFEASEAGDMQTVFDGLQGIMLDNPAPFGRISLIAFLIAHAGIALIMYNLPQDPKTNSHGPVPSV